MNGSMDHSAMLDLVAVYALGALGASEHRIVTAHLLTCDDCRAEFDALRPAADAVALMAEEPVDSATSTRMKARLMAQVNRDVERANVVPLESRRSRSFLTWAAAAAAGIAAVIALMTSASNVSLRSELATRNRDNATLQTQLARDARSQDAERTMVADLVASDGKHFPVSGGEVLEHGSRLYISMKALPALPKGKVYQAWTLAKGAKAVAPSVTFTPTRGGIAVVALPESSTNLVAVAVSVEPEGGSKTPTTKPTFVRPLS
jgi:anti-sigma-K factor RskA